MSCNKCNVIMIFNSVDFGLFFLIVFLLYWAFFQRNTNYRNIFLVIVSYFFYGWWDWRFLSLIAISSAIDYLAGKKIASGNSIKKQKRWLLLSITVNLGFLCFFKYFNFFIDSFVDSFKFFGADLEVQRINIILPVGISFYTFQTLSYTLDIYFKKMRPVDNIVAFFAFVSFFPQLVAGPIERAKDLLPQFLERHKISYEMLRSGLILMAWGFFKKIVIADRVAIFVDGAYGSIDSLDWAATLCAMVFFAFQLYLDFSAYSDIAIGSARMLGFNLSTNFKRPYLSTSFSDFWRRWHISLSSWFKDYVYIPLGGNRTVKIKHARNILIVFILSGLWHGASWNFVVWGGLNGLFILSFDRFLNLGDKNLFKRILTSVFICSMWIISLVFFRAQTFDDALTMLLNLGNPNLDIIHSFGLNKLEFSFTVKLLIGYVVFEIFQEKFSNMYEWFSSLHVLFRWTVYTAMIIVIIFYGSYGVGLNDNNFIYFQF